MCNERLQSCFLFQCVEVVKYAMKCYSAYPIEDLDEEDNLLELLPFTLAVSVLKQYCENINSIPLHQLRRKVSVSLECQHLGWCVCTKKL